MRDAPEPPQLLRYQLRYANGAEPETLIAATGEDALQIARSRAQLAGVSAQVWRNGTLIAEFAPQPSGTTTLDPELAVRLAEAGFYVIADRPQSKATHIPRPA